MEMTIEVRKLSPTKECRKEIARDVLEQLKMRSVVPESGSGYLFIEDYEQNEEMNEAPAQENMDLFRGCQVCALGACMVSMVRLYNEATVWDLKACSPIMWSKLATVFPVDQLVAMEYCFEGWEEPDEGVSTRFEHEISWDVIARTVDFYNEYPSDREKLEKIMLNILENDGEFVI